MTIMTQHLSVEELEARVRASRDVVECSHCQAIWLLAKGHTTAEVAEIVVLTLRGWDLSSFTPRAAGKR